LSFEHRSYEELASQLPKVGAPVETSYGRGRVRDRQILTQLVQVALDDNRLVAVPVEELSPARPQEGRRSAEDPVEGEMTEPEMEKSDSMDETSDVGLAPGPSEEGRPANENASQRKHRRRTRRKRKQ
jgi:hypothetical protein